MNDSQRLREIIRTQSEIAAASRTLPEVMQLIVDRAQELTSASGAVIELLEGNDMVHTTATGNLVPHLGLRVGLNESLSGLAVQLNEVLLCGDSEVDERVHREACRKVGLKSMICVPLRDEGRPVGVLLIGSIKPHFFDQNDVETLTLLSDMIGIAMAQARLIEQRQYESMHDSLTGLGNRRYYEETLDKEVARAGRYGPTMSLILMDLDGFKKANDEHGHPRGDTILATIGSRLAQSRQTDAPFRIGGDEFALILPGTDVNGAGVVIWRLHKEITSIDPEVGVGATFGVGEYINGETPQQFHTRTDRALVEAKGIENQRLRVVFSGTSDAEQVRV